jgi:hypothetical protein
LRSLLGLGGDLTVSEEVDLAAVGVALGLGDQGEDQRLVAGRNRLDRELGLAVAGAERRQIAWRRRQRLQRDRHQTASSAQKSTAVPRVGPP